MTSDKLQLPGEARVYLSLRLVAGVAMVAGAFGFVGGFFVGHRAGIRSATANLEQRVMTGDPLETAELSARLARKIAEECLDREQANNKLAAVAAEIIRECTSKLAL